ncbi:hypothetical protein LTR28_006323, partial [Elasticomyces elasticus]
MAFRAPQQRPQVQRQVSFSDPILPVETVTASPQRRKRIEDSQEWILFSPASNPTQSQASQTSQTPRTANFSRLSDYGSLETGAASGRQRRARGDVDEDPAGRNTEIDDEEELDSLDDGLHAFHAPSEPRLDHSGGTVLPTHDGLGMFAAAGGGMQEQLWQFERHNPHRRRNHQRRRSSVQRRLDALDERTEEAGWDREEERRVRIEKWRVEQSRAVLEEIEREKRRRGRRMSRLSQGNGTADRPQTVRDGAVSTGPGRRDSGAEGAGTSMNAEETSKNDSFWQRITRRVICDLMGLDETTLSVIFGEELPEAASATPTQSSPLATAAESQIAAHPGPAWDRRLLERIARELGILVHQLSEHEVAFSAYPRRGTQDEETLEYAGLPNPRPRSPAAARPVQIPQQAAHRQLRRDSLRAPSDALFSPTLLQGPASPPTTTTDVSLWGIEEEPGEGEGAVQTQTRTQREREQEYWERDLDARVIFSFLRNRFSPSPPANHPNPPPGPLPAAWSTTTTPLPTATTALATSPESLHRAALIRRQHPLVSRAAAAAARRRAGPASPSAQHASVAAPSSSFSSPAAAAALHGLKRLGGSECASQSTKKSKKSGS